MTTKDSPPMRKQFAALRAARRDHGRGFTLIELLIVVLILAILAAIVMFAIGSFTGDAAVAACNTDAKTVESAVSAYYVQNGTYPSSYRDLIPAGATSANGGPYLHAWPSNAPYYAISLDPTVPGRVDVSVPATATPVDYDTDNVCGRASGGKLNQTITFTSANPTPVTPGNSTYTPTATATSGLTVVLTVDSF